MRRLTALVAAAVAYLLAAWMVAPGFYDGLGPVQPYNWVCPPPQQAIYGNQPPLPGHLDIKVIGGVSDPSSAFTNDGQVVMSFLPGALDATGKTSISVDITPVSPCPKPAGLTFVTNAYQIRSTAPLLKDATLVMRYSDLVPSPSYVYFATSADGPWKTLNIAPQAAPFTVDSSTRQFGYFAAGYPANATTHNSGFNAQLIPIAVALLIVAVLVGGIPLAIVRRRRAGTGESEDDDEPDGP